MKNLLFTFLLIPFVGLTQIKNMDVPFNEYSYDSKGCSGFRHSSGSLIFIPADAFVTENGSACTGRIVIRYRELHTRADMLVSGINMTLFRDNKKRMLESVGMFEIKAECNGKPMKLANGKFIQVRMHCNFDINKIESFVYDKEKKYWLDAGLAVTDFSFGVGDMNGRNKNWGSSQIQGTKVIAADSNGDVLSSDGGYSNISNIVGKLPDGYFKGMNINKMGLYNYDAVIKDENAVPIMAKFKYKTGEDVVGIVYVAYSSKNTLIQYWPDDMKERFVLLPEKGIRIFTVLKDGSVAVMNQDELDKLNIPNLKGKEIAFTLEPVPAKPKDKMAIAKAVKIE